MPGTGSVGGDIGGSDAPGLNGGGSSGTGDSGGSDGAGAGGDTSTPFLVVCRDGKYEFENDILFGDPHTLFPSFRSGLDAYRRGITGDKYLIKKGFDIDSEGRFAFQIQEIEPEESYFDTLRLHVTSVGSGQNVVASGLYDNTQAFPNSGETSILPQEVHHVDVLKGRKKVCTNSLTPSNFLTADQTEGVYMPRQSNLVLRVPNSALSNQISDNYFIFLASHFRDWTLGDSVPFTTREKLWQQSKTYLAKYAHALPVASLAAVLTLAPYPITSKNESSSLSTTDLTLEMDFVKKARADYTSDPRCLVVHAHVADQVYRLGVIYPRYIKSNLEYIKLPPEIVSHVRESGSDLVLTVRATKNHFVSTFFVAHSDPQELQWSQVVMEKAVLERDQKDYSKLLQQRDEQFLHTYPGDRCNVNFKLPKHLHDESKSLVFSIETNGFYTPMTTDVFSHKGGWYRQLSKEARQILSVLKRNSVLAENRFLRDI